LHYQVENDSPGGATSNSKVHELGIIGMFIIHWP